MTIGNTYKYEKNILNKFYTIIIELITLQKYLFLLKFTVYL